MHAILFFILLTLLVGTAAITAVAWVLRRRSERILRCYLVFLVSFSLSVLEYYVFSYVRTNIGFPGRGFLLAWGAADAVTDMAVVVSGLYVFHDLYRLKRRRMLDGIATVSGIAACAVLLITVFITGWDFTIDGIHPAIVASLCAYYALFLWMILLNAAMIRKLTATQDRFLGWSLFVLALSGLAEAVISILELTGSPERKILPHNFYLSTVPWLIVCGGTVVLLPRFTTPNPPVLPAAVLERFSSAYGLSPRERDVLPLLLSGVGNDAIAKTLFISIPTVKSHVHSILKKTGARGRFELSVRIQSEG